MVVIAGMQKLKLSDVIAVHILMFLSPNMSVYLHKSYDYFAFMILSSNMFDCSTTNKDLEKNELFS